MTDNLQGKSTRHVFGLGREPEIPEETPDVRGEHADSRHAEWRQYSNPQPQKSDTNMLATSQAPGNLHLHPILSSSHVLLLVHHRAHDS